MPVLGAKLRQSLLPVFVYMSRVFWVVVCKCGEHVLPKFKFCSMLAAGRNVGDSYALAMAWVWARLFPAKLPPAVYDY